MFDKECRIQRHEVRKLSNLKHRDPANSIIREAWQKKLKEYRTLLKGKQKSFRDEKLDQLSKASKNSKSFWDNLKSAPETIGDNCIPPVKENEWLEYYEKLHSSTKILTPKQYF